MGRHRREIHSLPAFLKDMNFMAIGQHAVANILIFAQAYIVLSTELLLFKLCVYIIATSIIIIMAIIT